jgi:hypothetical protein
MRALLITLVTLLLANSVRCSDTDQKPLDEKFLRNYTAGEYDLIGRKTDSTGTYNGHVNFRDYEGVLQVTEPFMATPINALFHSIQYRAAIAFRLRMHFYFDGKEYEATHRWQSDPDNYPRFTGYFYLSGTKSPGLEALFPIHK